MLALRRVPASVWGVVVTVVVVTLLFVFAPEDKPTQDPAPTDKVSASQDPQGLVVAKRDLEHTIVRYVSARFERAEGIPTDYYIEQIQPLVSESHLNDIRALLGTPAEQSLAREGATVSVELVAPGPNGHIDQDGGETHYEGTFKVRLTIISESRGVQRLPSLDYELYMTQSDSGAWVVTYCSPTV